MEKARRQDVPSQQTSNVLGAEISRDYRMTLKNTGVIGVVNGKTDVVEKSRLNTGARRRRVNLCLAGRSQSKRCDRLFIHDRA